MKNEKKNRFIIAQELLQVFSFENFDRNWDNRLLIFKSNNNRIK